MRNGFTFNGRHSSEFDVTVKTKSRPLRPEVKSFDMDLPCRDGVYDFSKSNTERREFFRERMISISVTVWAENLCNMQEKLSMLSLWLIGNGELIFDDMPLIIWKSRVVDEIIYMPEHNGRKSVIDVTFKAEPFGFCVFDTDGPVLDTDIAIDVNIPMELESLMNFTVNGSGNFNVLNFGDRPVRPIIEMTGNVQEVILTMSGKSLSFSAGGNAEVNFEKQTITNSNGSVKVSGEFFEFPAGRSVLSVENSNTSSIGVKLSYVPCFMYGAHFDDVKWGVPNA